MGGGRPINHVHKGRRNRISIKACSVPSPGRVWARVFPIDPAPVRRCGACNSVWRTVTAWEVNAPHPSHLRGLQFYVRGSFLLFLRLKIISAIKREPELVLSSPAGTGRRPPGGRGRELRAEAFAGGLEARGAACARGVLRLLGAQPPPGRPLRLLPQLPRGRVAPGGKVSCRLASSCTGVSLSPASSQRRRHAPTQGRPPACLPWASAGSPVPTVQNEVSGTSDPGRGGGRPGRRWAPSSPPGSVSRAACGWAPLTPRGRQLRPVAGQRGRNRPASPSA